ncbi:MAG: multicopper oxidase family protein [Neomegalonema sp.]|nr:multicopper oxidase family protein [Neomegalonema sp.]
MNGVSRRSFTGGLFAAAVAAPLAPTPACAQAPITLTAQEGLAQLAPSKYPKTKVWGYEGVVPGPVLRVPQGRRLTRRFQNRLPQDSSIHWHGIRIANAMDGVPGVTQEPVKPGESFLYDFVAPDAGVYWYHPHYKSYEQVARGLYGALIVGEATGAPSVDHEEVLILDDWRLTREAQIADGFGAIHDAAHAGRLGNWVTVNGAGEWTREVKRFARLRLRLINAANARIFDLDTRGLTGWIVALDGMPLAAPQPLKRFALAPAQRADLIVDVAADSGGEAFLLTMERDGGYALATFAVKGEARPKALTAPAPLPPNPVPKLGDLGKARSVELIMEGGAMGGLRGAMLDGKMTSMRALVSAGKVWAFNKSAGMPAEPLLTAERGETVRISMANDTAWPHAMHLHGHHFRTVAAGGALGPLRDTLLMQPRAKAEIAFVADNPGEWLLHCHMLEHSAAGMMTRIRVT